MDAPIHVEMSQMLPHYNDPSGINHVQSEELHQHRPDEEDSDHDRQNLGSWRKNNRSQYLILLVINYFCLFAGSVSSSLLAKFYFIHKGSSRWVSTWVQCAGFPLLVIPILTPTLKRTKRRPFADFTAKMLIISVAVGLLLGVNNFLISWGTSYLPVSTSALVLSSQLGFNLIFSAILVKQKITFSNLNCVVLLTTSSVLVALSSSSDKPEGLTTAKYFIGFFCTVGAGLLFALYLPLVEMIYRKVYCYEMVMEMQLVMEIAATALASIGMLLDGGFSEMREESLKVFDLGPKLYWVTIFSTVVTWQLCFMGTAGMVFLTSSLTGGICSTALLAMNVLGGVLVYKDRFDTLKAVGTFICLWAFCSYVYGICAELKQKRRRLNLGNEIVHNRM